MRIIQREKNTPFFNALDGNVAQVVYGWNIFVPFSYTLYFQIGKIHPVVAEIWLFTPFKGKYRGVHKTNSYYPVSAS